MVHTIMREAEVLWQYFLIQLDQIFIYWVLGMVTGSMVSIFFKGWIHQRAAMLAEQKQGIIPAVVAIMAAPILGMASPLCMYGTIPIAAALSKSGVRDEVLASFMISSILLNPQLIVYSAALGMPILVVRILSCYLCGVFAGVFLLLRYKKNQKKFFHFNKFDEPADRDTDPRIIIRFLKNLKRNISATGKYFLIGILLSVLFQRYVPTEFVADLFGEQRGFGILLAATIGVPLYACGGGTIPLLMAWMNNGMSPGAAAAFMITGPATKITNLGALKIVLGIRHFILYLIFIIVMAVAAGIIVDFVM